MDNKLVLFNSTEGIILLRLLIIHFLCDFVLQNKDWRKDKSQHKIKSKKLYIHGLLNGLLSYLIIADFTLWWLPLIITLSHISIDLIKIYRDKQNSILGFIVNQLAHILVIVMVWLLIINGLERFTTQINTIASNYKIMMIVFGYILVIWPIGFLIGTATKSLIKKNTQTATQLLSTNNSTEDDAENGGLIIGIFERIIILTFVLFEQYEAIGFLITGKSILRLNTKKQTEYVLAGTMLSYALSIITGVLINYYLKFI